MQLYTHTLPSGAKLTGYLRDETNEMPAFNIRPAMLILPGGGYAFCSAREADPIAMQFLQAGYQTFVLEYTCAHTPEQAPLRWQPLIDAAGAILHLRRNAAKLRLDPFKIAVCGFSAGGHLAASTAILWDAAPVQKALGITAEEARPDAVVLGYPVITSGIKTHGPYELHLFTHGGHGSSTCTQEVNTPNRHNAAWVSLCTDWLAETLHFHL